MDLSPLSRLPPELRNDIYELVLAMHSPLTIEMRLGSACSPDTATKGKLSLKRGDPHCAHPTAFTQTCRQIRKEANGLFYTINTFTLDCKLFEPEPTRVQPFLPVISNFREARSRFDREVFGTDTQGQHAMLSVFIDSIGEGNTKAIKAWTVSLGSMNTISSHRTTNLHRAAVMLELMRRSASLNDIRDFSITLELVSPHATKRGTTPATTFKIDPGNIDRSLGELVEQNMNQAREIHRRLILNDSIPALTQSGHWLAAAGCFLQLRGIMSVMTRQHRKSSCGSGQDNGGSEA